MGDRKIYHKFNLSYSSDGRLDVNTELYGR